MKSLDEIRAALKRARQASGVTQAAVGKAAGLSNKTVSAFELGQTGLPWERLVPYAARCGWTLAAYLVPDAWAPAWEAAARLFMESSDAQRARIVRFLKVFPSMTPREQERLLRNLEETAEEPDEG